MKDLVPNAGRALRELGGGKLPTLFLQSPEASKRFWEFFTANIRNRNTRKAYFVAATHFSAWCARRKLSLEHVQPVHVAAYIEGLTRHSRNQTGPDMMREWVSS